MPSLRPPEWAVLLLIAASALPFLLVLCRLLWTRDDPEKDLMALALLLSTVADIQGFALQTQHQTNWWLGYCYAPVQFGLFLAVVAPRHLLRNALALIAVIAITSAIRGPWDRPELIVQTTGGLVAGLWGWRTIWRTPLLCYGLATLPGLLWMSLVPMTTTVWGLGFWLYQAARLVAIGAFLWVIGTGGRRGRPDREQVRPRRDSVHDDRLFRPQIVARTAHRAERHHVAS